MPLRLTEILAQVIELEHLIVQRVGIYRSERFPRGTVDFGAQR